MTSSKNKKKIVLITGSRSDYGLLTSLIKEIKKKNYYNLKIIAAGSHFDKNHGYSIKEIIEYEKTINKNYILGIYDCRHYVNNLCLWSLNKSIPIWNLDKLIE